MMDEIKTGVEDFYALTEAILTSAGQLNHRYDIFIDGTDYPGIKATSSNAWSLLFNTSFNCVKSKFLDRQRLSVSFDNYLRTLSQNEGRELSNELKLQAFTLIRGKLLEALCFLLTLETSDASRHQTISSLIRRCGPTEILEKKTTFVWTQPLLKETIRGMRARPDLVVSTSPSYLDADTVVRIVECKHRQNIKASDLRAEFGKAHDLSVSSYLILSYYDISESRMSAAQGLGLDITTSGLYGPLRNDLVSGKKALKQNLSKALLASREKASSAV